MIHFIWQALSCTSTFPLSSQSSFPPLNAFPNSGSSELRILLVLRFPGPVLLHVMMPHIYRNLWNAMWNLQVISKSSLELGFFFFVRFWWFLILWRAGHQLRGDSNLMKEKETEVNILGPRCRMVFLDLDFPVAWIYTISTPGTLLGKQRSWPFHLRGCEERLHSLVVLLCLSPENHSYVPFKYLPSCQECNFW